MSKKTIGECAKLIRGVSYKKQDAIQSAKEGYIPLLRANNILNNQLVWDELIYVPSEYVSNSQYIRAGNIIITMSSGSKAHVGKVALANKDYFAAFGAFCGKLVCEDINPKYLAFALQSRTFRQYIESASKGTNINNLKQSHILSYGIEVPKVYEQERIVSKIEELFSKLDASVAELQTAKEKLKVYRQAVLKEAFEGKLSEKWRNTNDNSPYNDLLSIYRKDQYFKDTSGDENEVELELPTTWIKIRIGEVFDVEVGATPKRSVSEYWNGDINWVSSGEVQFNTISQTKEKITKDGLAHSSTNLHPAGTVMLAMIGEGKTRGQAAILNVAAAHNQNTAAILVAKTPCDSKYLYYFLLLNYENTRRIGSGNNQKALNKERVRAIHFPFTSFKEQKIIVEEIENRLSVCDSIEQTIDTSLQQAEALRQSILKQAFEGRLL